MTASNARPGANAPPTDHQPFERALATGHLDPLLDDSAVRLLSELRTTMPATDISLEIAALRLILLRLLSEHHDLPSLVPLVTRVISVSIQGARAHRSLEGQAAEDLLGAIGTILDELAGSQP